MLEIKGPGKRLKINRQCYLATRQHHALGLLLKVGSSNNPDRRIKELGAIPNRNVWLHYTYETEIQRHLQRWRAWPPGDAREWSFPIFPAPSEWFLWNATSRRVLNAYLELQAAKRSTAGTLENLFFAAFADTQPDGTD